MRLRLNLICDSCELKININEIIAMKKKLNLGEKDANPTSLIPVPIFFRQGGLRLFVLFLLQNTMQYCVVFHASRPLTNAISSRLLSHTSPISASFLSLTPPHPGPPPLTFLIPTQFLRFSQNLFL